MIEQLGKWFLVKKFEIKQEILKKIHFEFRQPIADLIALWASIKIKMRKHDEGLNLALKSRRVANTRRTNKIVNRLISQEISGPEPFQRLIPAFNPSELEKIVSRILILKVPRILNGRILEKGVLVVKFSETFSVFFNLINVKKFSNYFNIVLEPSSAGYALPEILTWSNLYPVKVIVMSPYRDDFNFISSLELNIVPSELGASDWVNPNTFYKIHNTVKIYDSIYVANYNPVKRVDRYIRAVANIRKNNPEYKGALVCAGHGSAKIEIKEMLVKYKADEYIDFLGGMTQKELNLRFNQSKVNILLSFKEGANKGLAEGFFSGTPGLRIAENVGGNHAHINEFTGRTVPDAQLEQALLWFSDHFDEFSPDIWARKHMDPTVSTKKLSAQLESIEIAEGREWSNNLLVKTNTPELTYIDPENNWLLNERKNLLRIFNRSNVSENIHDYLKKFET